MRFKIHSKNNQPELPGEISLSEVTGSVGIMFRRGTSVPMLVAEFRNGEFFVLTERLRRSSITVKEDTR